MLQRCFGEQRWISLDLNISRNCTIVWVDSCMRSKVTHERFAVARPEVVGAAATMLVGVG